MEYFCLFYPHFKKNFDFSYFPLHYLLHVVGTQSFLVSVNVFWRVEGQWSGNVGWDPGMDSLNPRMRILSLLGIPMTTLRFGDLEDSHDSAYS